jgi:ribosomal protein L32
MEQRVYQGNISPDGLADYLVNSFNQGYAGDTVAQKVGQGDQVMVQIGRVSHSGRIRHSIGLSIARVPDGISVSAGQSNWLDDPAIGGTLIGAIFWPPLLLFPLARGIRNYGLYQDIWQAVDTYCLQAGGRPGNVTATHAVYCQNCGSINEEGVQTCRMCGAPLPVWHPQQGQQQAPVYRPPQPPAGQVVCPNCGQTVSAGKYCSNCAAPLPPVSTKG